LHKSYFVISVNFLSNFYEGKEWPPSPSRLFQALVATAFRHKLPSFEEIKALEWLETLPPPQIVACEAPPRSEYQQWGLENNLDEIAKKWVKEKEAQIIPIPKILEILRASGVREVTDHVVLLPPRSPKFLPRNGPHVAYIWELDKSSVDKGILESICKLANKISHLGRGEDLVAAWGRLIDDISEVKTIGETYIFQEKASGMHAVPQKGLFKELQANYQTYTIAARNKVPIGRIPTPENVIWGDYVKLEEKNFLLYRLRDPVIEKDISIRCELIAEISTNLLKSVSEFATEEEQLLFSPLPTIGSHADGRIRRILVTGSKEKLQSFDKISGLVRVVQPIKFVLNPWKKDTVVSRYMDKAEEWLSVTPVVLPISRKERCTSDKVEESLIQMIEQAGYSPTDIKEIWYRRSPLWEGSLHSEAYWYPREIIDKRSYHVAIRFNKAISGPVIIGLGRKWGLGLFAHS